MTAHAKGAIVGDAADSALVRAAGAWHQWNPRWLPSRTTRAIKRWNLRRYSRQVECRLRSGQRLMLSPADAMQWIVATTGGWEELIYEAVRPLIPAGSTVCDVGAHIGTSAVVFGAWAGSNGRVVCFEPSSSHVAQLSRNVALNGFDDRVTIVPSAVSDRVGSISFSAADPLNGGMSAIGLNGGTVVTVPTTTLDIWAERHGMQTIALVKIDVEGAEGLVLKGMRDGLARRRYRAILLELHPGELPRFGATVASVCGVLTEAEHRLLFWSDHAFRTAPGADDVYVLALAPGVEFGQT